MSHLHKISSIIKTQFPRFYDEEGPMFIEFVKAYYEWMDQEGGISHKSREMEDFVDIDSTLDEFVNHFQAAYLYGIPDQIRGDKRFLIKHILDVYRSKGSIQGFQLLFRLLYNEDIKVYLPSTDILRASDGTWYEPRYLEVTYHESLPSLVGNIIQGSSSRAEAIVEDYVTQSINGSLIHILYLSNVKGDFTRGEKVTDSTKVDTAAILDAPKILGSLANITIVGGGQQFTVGDTLKVTNGQGNDGEARVSAVANGTGTLLFTVEDGGSVFSQDAISIITRPTPNSHPESGRGASFEIGTLTNVQSVTYCEQVIEDYDTLLLNATDWGMSSVNTANISSTLDSVLTYVTKDFGSIADLDSIASGNNYVEPPSVVARDFIYSKPLTGNVFYSNTSVNITGNNTSFTTRFAPNTYLRLVGDPGTESVVDHRIVKTVVNNTFMTIDDYPNHSSNGNIVSVVINTAGSGYSNADTITVTGTGTGASLKLTTDVSGTITDVSVLNGGSGYYTTPTLTINTSTGTGGALTPQLVFAEYNRAYPTIQSSFTTYTNPSIYAANGSLSGLNEVITAEPLFGTGIISEVQVKNSGYNYRHGELLKLGGYGAVANVQVVSSGTGYKNTNPVAFSGGSPVSAAKGKIVTDANGSITEVQLTYKGSGYKTEPTISIISVTGSGAEFNTTIGGINTLFKVTGTASLGGLGKSRGHWTSTRGFLSDDKYIQDSYYYQEYSYEIRAPVTLSRYADIVKKVFHVAGKEMFGRVVLVDVQTLNPSSIGSVTKV